MVMITTQAEEVIKEQKYYRTKLDEERLAVIIYSEQLDSGWTKLFAAFRRMFSLDWTLSNV